MKNKTLKPQKGQIDWLITLVPLILIVGLCLLFFLLPEQSANATNMLFSLFGDTMGSFYLVLGLGVFLVAMFLSFSKYGKIVLGGKDEKPKYSFFAWSL